MPSTRIETPSAPSKPGLPPMPPEMQQAQATHWAKVPASIAPNLKRFVAQIERKRTEHAAQVGWRPAQAGYIAINMWRSRRFVRVMIADRDLASGVPVDGLNERLFALVEKATGDIYRPSTDGKPLDTPRGNIHNEQSSWRAITPFGIESR